MKIVGTILRGIIRQCRWLYGWAQYLHADFQPLDRTWSIIAAFIIQKMDVQNNHIPAALEPLRAAALNRFAKW